MDILHRPEFGCRATAYGHLTAEGFLEGRRGGGTVVSEFCWHTRRWSLGRRRSQICRVRPGSRMSRSTSVREHPIPGCSRRPSGSGTRGGPWTDRRRPTAIQPVALI